MPAISLVVCVYKETALLERLLREAADCYDDLVVVHDGEESSGESQSIEQLVTAVSGRFFIGPRSFQQEPHWPFAWKQAEHDWILRLDADEFPSDEMKLWLRGFRLAPNPTSDISGYTCIWPPWNGTRSITKRWPAGRIFLFNKQRIRFFGMVEQVPIADEHFEALPLILEHRPTRKSYGIRNVLFRTQAYRWRRVIAESLLKDPIELPGWRWQSTRWPREWEKIRATPIRTAFARLLTWPFYTTKEMLRHREVPYPSLVLQSALHHFLICLEYLRARKRARSLPPKCSTSAEARWP